MAIKKEWLVERQGKSFVLYAGILDTAHKQGLKSIETQIVQIPCEQNHFVAICTARAVFEVDGTERTFAGIGDAAPNNVGPAMRTCLLRMAETRAKARALRDGVNIACAAFEELGAEDDHTSSHEQQAQLSAQPKPEGSGQRQGVRMMTRDQGDKIASKCRELGVNIPQMDRWTDAQACSQMRALQQLEQKRATIPRPAAPVGG